MHKHNFGQTLLQTMYLCKFGAENPTGSEDRVQKKAEFTVLRDDDLEMR